MAGVVLGAAVGWCGRPSRAMYGARGDAGPCGTGDGGVDRVVVVQVFGHDVTNHGGIHAKGVARGGGAASQATKPGNGGGCGECAIIRVYRFAPGALVTRHFAGGSA